MSLKIRKSFCRMALLLTVLMTVMLMPVSAAQAEDTPVDIYTVDQFMAIFDEPDGSYRLMADLDMTGVEWPCPDFFGKLDGNGHSILNVTITKPGTTMELTMDGNSRSYETYFAGFFGTLVKAEVTNLNLVNLRALVETDDPCFLGGFAGYMEDSTITGCSVSGSLELRAHDRMLGVGGAAGYGVGQVIKCNISMTMICVDTDANNLDEQFLGGVFGTGFIGSEQNNLYIDAYISEHGYVHSGGITGMFMQNPVGMGRTANLIQNTGSVTIRFFEDNADRRAYCEANVGEQINIYNYRIQANSIQFKKEETREYGTELRPEKCSKPEYETTVHKADCGNFGFTEYHCKTCEYTYTDLYTLQEHSIKDWKEAEAATTESFGLSVGKCTNCGKEIYRTEPMLIPEPETEPATEAVTEETEQTEPEETVKETKKVKYNAVLSSDVSPIIPIMMIGIVAIGCFLAWLLNIENRKDRKRKHKK